MRVTKRDRGRTGCDIGRVGHMAGTGIMTVPGCLAMVTSSARFARPGYPRLFPQGARDWLREMQYSSILGTKAECSAADDAWSWLAISPHLSTRRPYAFSPHGPRGLAGFRPGTGVEMDSKRDACWRFWNNIKLHFLFMRYKLGVELTPSETKIDSNFGSCSGFSQRTLVPGRACVPGQRS